MPNMSAAVTLSSTNELSIASYVKNIVALLRWAYRTYTY
jgi:hypothetical protein